MKCVCPENDKPLTDRAWEITQIYSTKTKGKRKECDNSEVYCKKCGRFWRTKADYVTGLLFARKIRREAEDGR